MQKKSPPTSSDSVRGESRLDPNATLGLDHHRGGFAAKPSSRRRFRLSGGCGSSSLELELENAEPRDRDGECETENVAGVLQSPAPTFMS